MNSYLAKARQTKITDKSKEEIKLMLDLDEETYLKLVEQYEGRDDTSFL